MKSVVLHRLIFETAWGWCGTLISERGIAGFQLPVKDIQRAQQLLDEQVHYSSAHGTDAVAVVDLRQREIDLNDPATSKTAKSLIQQVRDYFNQELRVFDLPLDWAGRTKFQQMIWKALCQIPFGQRICYGELAAKAGNPKAARAVGRAMATNPIPLIVPCHRVVGADGSMCGFSADGGIPIKQRLLRFEEEGRKG